MFKKIKFLIIVFTLLLTSCLTGGHGSIKAYEYQVNKKVLEEAVEMIIKNNKNIIPDTIKNYIIDVTNGRNDTIWDNYYNDTTTYRSISIKINGGSNSYIFRYGGDKQYWDTSIKSSIFIAYAYDKNNKGGSEGYGGVEWYHWGLKKRLINPFEKELILKIDSVLKIEHEDYD